MSENTTGGSPGMNSDARPGRAVMTTTIASRRADSIRLGPWHQGAVYGATAALVVSGIIWLVLHYFLTVPGEYGPQIHPLEPWMLRLHGAAAMAGLIIYGSLLPVHVRRAWSIRRNIALGIGLVAFMLLLTAATFCLFGFIIGIWAKGFEQLQFIPMLVITPLTFLGGAFYSIDILPPAWRTVSLFNPIVYLISGFRWSFYGTSDVGVGVSLAMTLVFFVLCLAGVVWIFRTGYRLKS